MIVLYGEVRRVRQWGDKDGIPSDKATVKLETKERDFELTGKVHEYTVGEMVAVEVGMMVKEGKLSTWIVSKLPASVADELAAVS